MKNISLMLNDLKSKPEFKKLTEFELIKKGIESLNDNLKRGIRFAFIRRNSIVFVLSHPLFKKEFIFAKEKISVIFKNLEFEQEINSMSFIVSNNVSQFKYESSNNKPFPLSIIYDEKSTGNFLNNAKDKKIFRKFEKIKLIIKENIAIK